MNSDALPLVSVIIPVFNTEKYIEDCIFSVINQNYSRLEIIIVNDGSTDGSRSIIQKYMEVDRRIVCIDKKNEGLPLARKTGILKANGKYIQHLDSDDTLIDGAIEKLVCRAEETDADIVASSFLFCYPDKGPVLSEPYTFGEISGISYFRQKLNLQAYWSVWSHFQKRSLFLNNKIETVADISIGENAIMMTQLILATDRIVSLNIPTVNYYRNSSSMSCLPNEEKYKDFRAYQRWIEKYVSAKGLSEQLGKEIAYMHLQTAYTSLYWKQYGDVVDDMRRLVADVKRYPDLVENLSRRERKLLKAYKLSTFWGNLRVKYYILKNKL